MTPGRAAPDGDLAGLTVVVLDAGAKCGPTVVRSLGRAGARVLAAHPDDHTVPAQRSRWAAASLTHPHALADPDGLVEWLSEMVERERPACVLPMAEYTVRVLDRARERFSGRTALGLPPTDTLDVAFDKELLLGLAGSLGIASPTTWTPASLEDAFELAQHFSYPVYVKARESYDVRRGKPEFARGRFAHDPGALRDVYTQLDRISPLPMIQEALTGKVTAVSGVWEQGVPRAIFCYTDSYFWPVSGGYGVVRVSVAPQDAPLAAARALMASLKWDGVAEVEFISGDDAGPPRLLEVNGRFWGATEFAHYCGVDVAVEAVRVALRRADHRGPDGAGYATGPDDATAGASPITAPDDPAWVPTPYPVGRWARWLEGDLKRLYSAWMRRPQMMAEALHVPGRMRALFDFLYNSSPWVHQDDWYFDDPMPMVATLGGAIVKARRGGDPGAPR